jgi:hypothetical protein
VELVVVMGKTVGQVYEGKPQRIKGTKILTFSRLALTSDTISSFEPGMV